MGYRHIFVSDTMVPRKEDLPEWFVTKWEHLVSFKENQDFWCSYTEMKRYGAFSDFAEDVQKVMKEHTSFDECQLVWFADEGSSGGFPFIYTTITEQLIKECELVPNGVFQ